MTAKQDLDIDNLYSNYLEHFEELLNISPYSLPKSEKQARLLPLLEILHRWHCSKCPEYARITGVSGGNHNVQLSCVSAEQYIAVRLFKMLSLSSIPKDEVFKVLYSSGTTSQVPAQIFLDQQTAARQSKVLVKIMQSFLGKQRLPMLVIDCPEALSSSSQYSARGAGIRGLSLFSRDMAFALTSDMKLDFESIRAFQNKHQGKPILIFGFTFMVWKYFIRALEQHPERLDLSAATLIHSGGWKKLEAEKVSNHHFKDKCRQVLSLAKVHNFYGMAEQVGSIFVECEHGHLHAPVFSDVIVRDPQTLKETMGHGLIQVVSALPTSYPGHSILTEDLGRVVGEDDCDCGRLGKYFEVTGRLPKAEVRGCSDTFSTK